MNKEGIYRLLDAHHIAYQSIEHRAVYNMAEMHALGLPHPQGDAKNLFVRDHKKRHYYMITVKGDKKVDLKAFQIRYGTGALGFASSSDLWDILQLTAGAVTPLGILNDINNRVQLYIDEALLAPPGLIGVHPNDNTATLWLSTADLISLLEQHGHPVQIVQI